MEREEILVVFDRKEVFGSVLVADNWCMFDEAVRVRPQEGMLVYPWIPISLIVLESQGDIS